jgi:hypothetical protein
MRRPTPLALPSASASALVWARRPMKALVSTGKGTGMNKSQLVNAVAEQANLTKREARIAVNVVLEELSKAPANKSPANKARAKAAPAKAAPAKTAAAASPTKRSMGAQREALQAKKPATPNSAAVRTAPTKKAPATGTKSTTRSAFVSEAKIDTRGQTPPPTGARQP